MSDPSRRRFLALAGAGAGATAVGVGFAVRDTDAKPPAAIPPSGHTDPLVAWITDAHTGQIQVMVGERQVVVNDRELAARIARVVA
jgi:poly(3-hydroxybutyrate) depolymerase